MVVPAPLRLPGRPDGRASGGAFHVQILDPEGKVLEDSPGCNLEVIENERLAWTSAPGAGFRPVAIDTAAAGCAAFPITAVLSLEALGTSSTRYTARAPRHCRRCQEA